MTSTAHRPGAPQRVSNSPRAGAGRRPHAAQQPTAPRDPRARAPQPGEAPGEPGDPDARTALAAAVDAERVFAALADPRRRELLELLARTPGCSASSLAALLPVSRQAVAQHLAVLEDSSLVSRRRAGREVLFSVRPEGLAATADWLTGRAALWRQRLASFQLETEDG